MTQEAEKQPAAVPACRNCRFYEEKSNAHGSFGKCRALSPRWRGVPQHMDDDRATWPEVDGDDWCGEHQPREAAVLLGVGSAPPSDHKWACLDCPATFKENSEAYEHATQTGHRA